MFWHKTVSELRDLRALGWQAKQECKGIVGNVSQRCTEMQSGGKWRNVLQNNLHRCCFTSDLRAMARTWNDNSQCSHTTFPNQILCSTSLTLFPHLPQPFCTVRGTNLCFESTWATSSMGFSKLLTCAHQNHTHVYRHEFTWIWIWVAHDIPYGQQDGNRLDSRVSVQGLSSAAADELIPPISWDVSHRCPLSSVCYTWYNRYNPASAILLAMGIFNYTMSFKGGIHSVILSSSSLSPLSPSSSTSASRSRNH